MDIIIRQARVEDALFLTSISFGAKKYWNYSEEYLIGNNESLTITESYLKENIVFVAQNKETIIGYCSLHEVKEDYIKNGEVIEVGYWVDHLFIRPAYINNGIGRKLIEEVKIYCKENGIAHLNVLSCKKTNGFYEKMGAKYIKDIESKTNEEEMSVFRFMFLDIAVINSGNETIEKTKNEEQDLMTEIQKIFSNKAKDEDTLSDKIFELDKDLEEDDIYINQDTYQEEPYDKQCYDREERADEEIDDGQECHNNEEANQEEIQIDNTDETNNKDTSDQEQLVSRLSYEDFMNSTVPIGYKFECEEEEESLDNPVQDENSEPVKEDEGQEQMDKLSEEELEILLGRVDIEQKENIQYKAEQAEATEEEVKNTNQEEIVQSVESEYQALVKQIVKKGQVAEASSLYAVTEESTIKEKQQQYMTLEKAKMLAGEMYIAWGDEFVDDRRQARKLLKEFNNTDPEDKRMTHTILAKLFGKVGEYVHIEPNFKCNYGYNIEVGDNFYAGYSCVIVDNARVKIGDNCIISPQVGIYTLAYPLNSNKRVAGYEYAQSVTIGDNVWIGGGSTINPGVTIGDNVVIAPGSVIVSDVPNDVLVGGNPAKVIKNIAE